MQAHKPEVCYPAKGFTLRKDVEAEIETPFRFVGELLTAVSVGDRGRLGGLVSTQ